MFKLFYQLLLELKFGRPQVSGCRVIGVCPKFSPIILAVGLESDSSRISDTGQQPDSNLIFK